MEQVVTESAFMADGEEMLNMAGSDAAPTGDLPGESSDGRMGADIQMLITDITDYRDLLNAHTTDDKENLQALDDEIELLEYRQSQIESRLQKRRTAKDEYLKTLADTERAFNQIVNTANAVAGILKPKTKQELDAIDMPDSAAKADAYVEDKK